MRALKQSEILKILREQGKGIDELTIIPLIDLSGPLLHVLTNIERGLIPRSYKWSREKTKYAYTYKDYREWGKSIILGAKYYFTDEKYTDETELEGKKGDKAPVGTIARFTWRNNYGYLVERISELLGKMEKILGRKIRSRVLSNYTSLPEKVLFASSGLAQFGKNSLLIHKKMGSYFVIGEAITDIEVEFDSEIIPKAPDFSICGTCRLCMDACPSGAILEEGTIDINSCFQYISQNLLSIPREYMERWDKRLYGCSNCLDACPYNSELSPWAEKHNTGFVGPGMDLLKVLSLTEDQWQKTFKNNQIGMRERLAILKNA
ncbi:MAG: epoxyqueuosine reductase, partial [Spirochaetota bacterium]